MGDLQGFSLTVHPEDQAQEKSVDVTSRDGAVEVRVAAGATFRKPVKIVWGYPECGAKTQIIFHVQKNARVIIIEELHSVKNTLSWSHECTVTLDEAAEVEFISVNRVGAGVALEIQQQSTLGDNAKISWKNVTLAAASVHHDLTSTLTGSDAQSSVDWMFYAKDEEKYQLRAQNVFMGRNGSGEMTMKGVAEDRGHVRCDGKIEIGARGGGTDTYLTQDVLMLDKTAKVDAVPGLEIKTNDVKASHSATVSRVTEEDLFYFAARGIIEKEAKRMFVEGFLGEMVAKIGDATAREQILASAGGKYGS